MASTVDIDTKLTRLRATIKEAREHWEAGRDDAAAVAALVALDHAETIDAHMSSGGTLPAQWRTRNPCHI